MATVQAGYVERQGAVDHPGSPLRVVRARDLGADGAIDWSDVRPCEQIRDPERFAVRPGDVLLTTRTTQIRATAVDSPPPDVIASAQFAILRPDSERVDSHYLAWALDRAHAAGRLRSLIKGSTVQYLAPADLAGFEIPLPPLERQRLIARAAALQRKQVALLARLSELHDRVLDASLAADFPHSQQP
ncbi:MAG: restriction endonuclease subunit S [Planctomycetes bacterium]|nr:restriction endonuclease subunit S [Planctomycetota bacterium]